MTRINLIDPSKLTDQHLKAEIRELNRIGSLVAKYQVKPSFSKGKYSKEYLSAKLPSKFSLGTGHVKFFYNKGLYLHKRFTALREELNHRGFYNFYKFDFRNTWCEELYQDWKPTEEDCEILKERILYMIMKKPSWYNFYNKTIDWNFLDYYIKDKEQRIIDVNKSH